MKILLYCNAATNSTAFEMFLILKLFKVNVPINRQKESFTYLIIYNIVLFLKLVLLFTLKTFKKIQK